MPRSLPSLQEGLCLLQAAEPPEPRSPSWQGADETFGKLPNLHLVRTPGAVGLLRVGALCCCPGAAFAPLELRHPGLLRSISQHAAEHHQMLSGQAGKQTKKERAQGKGLQVLCMPMCLWVPSGTGSCQGFGKGHGEPWGQVPAPAAVSPSVPVPAASIVDAEPRVRATSASAAKHKPACASPGGEAAARKLKEKPGKGRASSGDIPPKTPLSQTAGHGAQQHLQFGAEIQQNGTSSTEESGGARQ